MSFLFPLVLAGMAAIGLPIILHMIRRHTRNRVQFSSLMFLTTSPPRMHTRSRLENLLLLILRCLVVILLVLAFSRPFLPATVEIEAAPGRRIALLVDTSASMQRGDLWTQATDKAREVLESFALTDRVALFAFDSQTVQLMDFEQWLSLGPAERISTAVGRLSALSPSWSATHLGLALVTAAEALEDDRADNADHAEDISQVVLITDLQQGSRLEALHAYPWPQDIELVIEPVAPQNPTNAALQLVSSAQGALGDEPGDAPRVRITNSSDAATEHFRLAWAQSTADGPAGETTELYVPPGRSLVVRAPTPPVGTHMPALLLSGDDHGFDNRLFLASHITPEIKVLYIGSDRDDDVAEPLYYLRLAFQETALLKPQIIVRRPSDTLTAGDIEDAHLIIITESLEAGQLAGIGQHLESGRMVLVVMKSTDTSQAIAALAGIDQLSAQEAGVDGYAMLGHLDFQHPVLAPFADPRFRDFTKIHFWKYRRLDLNDLPNARILAAFDNDDPAWFELAVGKGSLLVMTAGWHHPDSELALSSKFVPLLYSILERGAGLGPSRTQYFVGDRIPIPSSATFGDPYTSIHKPDQSQITLAAKQSDFTQADMPGIYLLAAEAGEKSFAVNLSPSECRTAPMPIEDLEKLVGSAGSLSLDEDESAAPTNRPGQPVELERQQKYWRPIIFALLGLLVVETWLAGWLTRSHALPKGDTP